MIKVEITHEQHKATPTPEQRTTWNNIINGALLDIHTDVEKWNGHVEVKETQSGNFSLLAHCDNIELRNKMQNLLHELISVLRDKKS